MMNDRRASGTSSRFAATIKNKTARVELGG